MVPNVLVRTFALEQNRSVVFLHVCVASSGKASRFETERKHRRTWTQGGHSRFSSRNFPISPYTEWNVYHRGNSCVRTERCATGALKITGRRATGRRLVSVVVDASKRGRRHGRAPLRSVRSVFEKRSLPAGRASLGRARPCSFIGLDIIRGETWAVPSPIRLPHGYPPRVSRHVLARPSTRRYTPEHVEHTPRESTSLVVQRRYVVSRVGASLGAKRSARNDSSGGKNAESRHR